jgi:hypothetical protein
MNVHHEFLGEWINDIRTVCHSSLSSLSIRSASSKAGWVVGLVLLPFFCGARYLTLYLWLGNISWVWMHKKGEKLVALACSVFHPPSLSQ